MDEMLGLFLIFVGVVLLVSGFLSLGLSGYLSFLPIPLIIIGIISIAAGAAAAVYDFSKAK